MSYIVMYDWNDSEGYTTYGIREKHETWEESQEAIKSLKKSDGASRIELIQEEVQ